MKTTHFIVALVENKAGVLNRVASLLRHRNFNISSVTVGKTEKPEVSRMTLVFDGEKTNTEQVVKQLGKLINVLKVWDATAEKLIVRETLLLRVAADKKSRGEILEFAEAFQAKVNAVYKTSLILEITGAPQRIDDFVDIMKDFGILEMVRTGATVLQSRE